MFIVKIDSQADRTLSYSEFLKSDFSLVPPSIRHYLTVPCAMVAKVPVIFFLTYQNAPNQVKLLEVRYGF